MSRCSFCETISRSAGSTLATLASIVDKAKSVVPTHPHPLVPGTATAQLVAGPWAAMVDKARDLVGAITR